MGFVLCGVDTHIILILILYKQDNVFTIKMGNPFTKEKRELIITIGLEQRRLEAGKQGRNIASNLEMASF